MIEYRLYYDDSGKVLCYTTENLEGRYITIDRITFVMSRHDVRVIDNKVIQLTDGSHIIKLAPQTEIRGTPCHKDNVLVIDDVDPVYWDLKVYDK